MQQSAGQRAMTGPAVVGVLLIAFGATALLLREIGVNPFGATGTWGWPFFVIVPGVVLLVASFVPAPPKGIGFAIAGAIVTTVGALLLYQSRTGHWESWAYAWALIPLAAGSALVLYGLLARASGMVTNGLTIAGIAAALFLAGAWFFEDVFAAEPRPTEAGAWWPIGAIVLGGLIVLRAGLPPTPRPSSGEPVDRPAKPSDQAHAA